MDIGSRVRVARKHAHYSQEGLARRAGLSVSAIAQIEQGGRPDPHYSTLSKIADSLDMSVAELLGEPEYAGKVEAPEEGPEQRGVAKQTWRSWAIFTEAFAEQWSNYLDSLPKSPSAEKHKAGVEVLRQMHTTVEAIDEALESSGIKLRVYELVAAEREGRQRIPDEIRGVVVRLYNSLLVIFESNRVRAQAFKTRQADRFEVAEVDQQVEDWASAPASAPISAEAETSRGTS